MSTKTIRAVERAIDVLDAIRSAGGTAGISEISRELRLPKSTVHRILVALSNKAILRKEDATDRYSFGQKTFELAFSPSSQWDLISIALPYLEQLRDLANETTTLAVKIGPRHADVAYALSQSPLCWTPRLGEQYPLHWGAMGKAVLAFLPAAEIEDYLRSQLLVAATDRTTTDPAVLRDDLERVRSIGYAISSGEHVVGAVAAAAPIRNAMGFAYAGVAVQGPEERMRRLDMAAIGEKVAEVCRKVERACQVIGGGGPMQARTIVGVSATVNRAP